MSSVTVVSGIENNQAEVGRIGVIIPILQMRKQCLREYTSYQSLQSW